MKSTALTILAILWSADACLAQTPMLGKVSIMVNGGYQLATNDFSDGAVKRENGEDGRIDMKYAVKAGPTFDLAGGGTVWRRLGVGVGVSRFSVSTPASLTGTTPHPFFFNRLRSISGEAGGLKRDELAIHIQATTVLPVGARWQMTVFGGPSFFRLKQGVVTDFTHTESYPYDQAQFGTVTTTKESASKIGLNVGGDVAFFFTRQIGVGTTLQFAGTTVKLPVVSGGSEDVRVGGGRVGAGLRLRF